MVIKRKRSDSDFRSFNSSVSATSFNFDAIAAMETARRGFFSPRLSSPSHLHSRTMKRVRDNRPSEEMIHQRTLNLLYSAQQHQNQPSTPAPEISVTPTPVAPQTPSRETQCTGPQQRSLHSFWNIRSSSLSVNSSPSRNASSPVPEPAAVQQTSNDSIACEDCGACLRSTNDTDGDMMMDVDMDIDGSGNACGACGKAVCFSCSVSNLGENRRCLVCAGRENESGNRSGWMTSVDVF
ncbi:hypothetical protein QBC43DRAFT_321711 [Cladorrhinum sp. PSN259]|nr:hypothetical protein QBC43DRAFT_321711 [Cladorrhinum sp. PSN259]